MADIELVIDLAIIMLVAAAITLIFSKLKQPLILGYLIAGMIIGPIASFAGILTDVTLLGYIADLGIVLLMFTLGLEFTLGRLREIGLFALAIGTIETILMIGVGFWTGQLLGFDEGASLLLGAIMAISSTAIVVKTMQEFGTISRQHSQIVVGILVVEDVTAVVILALISGLGGATGASISDTFQIIISMVLFLIASIAIGLVFVPKIISKVARTRPTEVLLIVSLALCFGLAVLSSWLGFSLAIGAFIAGMLVGESEDVDLVVLKTTPIREMFVAVFFVAMGMLFNPGLLWIYLIPALVVILFFTIGKSFLIGTGTFMFGFPAKTALLAGTGMVAMGEFSLIICRAGIDAGLAGEYLYSITVLVATITAFTLPLSVKNGEKMFSWIARHASTKLKASINTFQGSLTSARSHTKRTPEESEEWHRRGLSSLIDIAIIAIIAVAFRIVYEFRNQISSYFSFDSSLFEFVLFIVAAALLLPPIVHFARNLAAMIQLVVKHSPKIPGEETIRKHPVTNAIAGIMVAVIGFILLFIALPLITDPRFHESLSPAVFLTAVLMIILLAWYLNKTMYKSFSMHMQRDFFKEHLQVGAQRKELVQVAPVVNDKSSLLDDKDE